MTLAQYDSKTFRPGPNSSAGCDGELGGASEEAEGECGVEGMANDGACDPGCSGSLVLLANRGWEW